MSGAAKRLGGAGAGRDRKYHLYRRRDVHTPPGSDRQGAPAGTRAKPRPHDVTVEHERGARAAPIVGPVALGAQWAVGDADARYAEHGAEVQSKSGAAWMVASSRIHQQHIGQGWQLADRCL